MEYSYVLTGASYDNILNTSHPSLPFSMFRAHCQEKQRISCLFVKKKIPKFKKIFIFCFSYRLQYDKNFKESKSKYSVFIQGRVKTNNKGLEYTNFFFKCSYFFNLEYNQLYSFTQAILVISFLIYILEKLIIKSGLLERLILTLRFCFYFSKISHV